MADGLGTVKTPKIGMEGPTNGCKVLLCLYFPRTQVGFLEEQCHRKNEAVRGNLWSFHHSFACASI